MLAVGTDHRCADTRHQPQVFVGDDAPLGGLQVRGGGEEETCCADQSHERITVMETLS